MKKENQTDASVRSGTDSLKMECRALWYELIHTRILLRVSLLYMLLLCALTLIISMELEDEGLAKTASNMMVENPDIIYVFSNLVIGLLVGSIAGGDLKDKVANYELMAGHSRKNVFLSRSLVATLFSAAVLTVAGFATVLFATIVYGFGDAITPGGLAVRLGLMFFPYLRIAAFLTLVAFAARGKYLPMVFGMLYTYLVMILETVGGSNDYATGYFSLRHVMDFTTWQTYNISPVKGIVEYYAYDASVSASLAVETIGISLLMTAVYLMIGYALFRRDDLN